jgi:hypothetical protein
MLRKHRSLEGLLCNRVMMMIMMMMMFFCFSILIEHRWDENDREKPKYSEKTCPSATLSTTNPARTDPGSKPGLRGETPATSRLSHGTAFSGYLGYQSCKRSNGYLCHYAQQIYQSSLVVMDAR